MASSKIEKPHSQLLEEFRRKLHLVKSEEEKESLWSSIETPFIEEIPEIGSENLVTFLYRDKNLLPDEDVYLYSAVTGPSFTERNRLMQVTGTDILYLSLELPSALRTTYNFVKLSRDSIQIQPESNELLSSPYPIPVGKFKKNQQILSTLYENGKVEVDTHNKQKMIYYIDPEKSDAYFGMESILELPLAAKQPYSIDSLHDVTQEQKQLKNERRLLQDEIKFENTSLKNEDAYKNNSRKYWIYLPPGYHEKQKIDYPLFLFLDGSDFIHTIPAPCILEKMILDVKMPASIAIFLDYSMERRQQEYYCDEKFTHFIASDLINLLRNKHQLTITQEAKMSSIVGLSASGLAAFYTGIRHADRFQNVITFSASFESVKLKDLEHVINENRADLQNSLFYFDAGSYENTPINLKFPDGTEQGLSILDANKNLANLMLQKGLDIHSHTFIGGHNYICWKNLLPNRLIEMMENRLAVSAQNKIK